MTASGSKLPIPNSVWTPCGYFLELAELHASIFNKCLISMVCIGRKPALFFTFPKNLLGLNFQKFRMRLTRSFPRARCKARLPAYSGTKEVTPRDDERQVLAPLGAERPRAAA